MSVRVPLCLAMLCAALPSLRAQAVPDTTVTIRASSSTLEFDPAAIALKQGIRVRVRFVNTGTLPHNFVLVRDESEIDSLAAAAARHGGNYLPMDQLQKLIAYTPLVSPGRTAEVSFVVPAPGVYTFVCLMSGHSNSMLGTLRALR